MNNTQKKILECFNGFYLSSNNIQDKTGLSTSCVNYNLRVMVLEKRLHKHYITPHTILYSINNHNYTKSTELFKVEIIKDVKGKFRRKDNMGLNPKQKLMFRAVRAMLPHENKQFYEDLEKELSGMNDDEIAQFAKDIKESLKEKK
jgi:hypothetical protein